MPLKQDEIEQIKRQVTHCVETYQNDQEQLKFKLVDLIIEWCMRGLTHEKVD